MKKKYHISTSGFLSDCEARIRSCPRGQHFDQQEYDQLASARDPRVAMRMTKNVSSYMEKAHAQYVEAAKTYYSPKFLNYRNEEMKKLDIDSDSLQKASEDHHHHYNKLGKHVRRVLAKHGINQWDTISYVNAISLKKYEDTQGSESRRITNEVIDKLKNDSKFQQLNETVETFRKKKEGLEALHVEVEKRFNREAATKQMRKAEKELHKAKLWQEVKIPEGSKDITFSELDPKMLSYGPYGINNLWVQGPIRMFRVLKTDGKWLYGERDRIINSEQPLVLTP